MASGLDDSGARDGRPSPNALLHAAQLGEHGRLKIFLGAAPGVGKTYEMLSTARVKRDKGVDVAVGVVETHGRAETEALVEGLEIVPRRRVEYKGRALDEMDVDAILARRPQLVLVDELAHTSAPESRHPKRYMDVEELIAAGIDVYTTLNIQHLESLNDVVARITRIRVRETVPDSIIDRADDIEVIDLTPEDLLKRLREGKVYVPHQAERAVKHYFLPGNLTALRELALRRTAPRVDEQMVNYMQTHAIQGPWAAGERVLVCVRGDKSASAVVRHARRMGDRLRASWTALNVQTSRSLRIGEAERNRVAEAMRLAERLGAETVSLPGQDVAETIAEYARANNFTHLIIAKRTGSRWLDLIGGSVTQQHIRNAGGANVHVMGSTMEVPEMPTTGIPAAARPGAGLEWSAYAGSLALVAAALAVGVVLRETLAVSSITLAFLMAVLASAVTYGLLPSLFACLASVLAYNFFFLPPLYTFTITDPENVVALFVLAVVAVIASNLTARVRAEAITARQRARTAEELYQFSRKLAVAANLEDLLWATVHQIAPTLKVRVVILLPEGDRVTVRAGFPPEDMLNNADFAAARWSWEKNHAAGRGADTLPGAKRVFLPMQTGRGAVGVIGIDRDEPGPILTPDQRRLLNALSDQAALAVERVNLVEDVDRARLAAETDRARGALLTSISHDLRTPLASILGSATSLSTHGQAMEQADRVGLLRTIQEEAERLNRLIGNLLDTRLESGPLEPRTSFADLSDVIGAVLHRAGKILSRHRVQVGLEPELPMLDIDMVLFEQVLFNLLANAAKYAPPGSLIRMAAWRDLGSVIIQVLDEGEGVPPEDVERVFEKFYRARSADRRRTGTGLGLAICKGFVDAMSGTITAANRRDGKGVVFTISLPVHAGAERLAETAL